MENSEYYFNAIQKNVESVQFDSNKDFVAFLKRNGVFGVYRYKNGEAYAANGRGDLGDILKGQEQNNQRVFNLIKEIAKTLDNAVEYCFTGEAFLSSVNLKYFNIDWHSLKNLPHTALNISVDKYHSLYSIDERRLTKIELIVKSDDLEKCVFLLNKERFKSVEENCLKKGNILICLIPDNQNSVLPDALRNRVLYEGRVRLPGPAVESLFLTLFIDLSAAVALNNEKAVINKATDILLIWQQSVLDVNKVKDLIEKHNLHNCLIQLKNAAKIIAIDIILEELL